MPEPEPAELPPLMDLAEPVESRAVSDKIPDPHSDRRDTDMTMTS